MTQTELKTALEEWEADCYLVREDTTDRRIVRICDGMLSTILQEQAMIPEDDGIDHEFLSNFWQDPIIHRDDGWFFYDETWGNVIGPFKSRGAAVFGLKQYVRGLG
jgi:hypothetical protein